MQAIAYENSTEQVLRPVLLSSDPAADDALKATKLPDAATQATANNGGGIGTYAGMSGSVGPSDSPIHLHCGGVVFDLEE